MGSQSFLFLALTLLALLPCSVKAYIAAAPGMFKVGRTMTSFRAQPLAVGLRPANSVASSLRVTRASPLVMALEAGDRVVVLGGFERIGICTLQGLTQSQFKPVMQTPQGFTEESRVKWPIDGLGQTMPKGVQYSADLPVCPGAILASEAPAEASEIKAVLGYLQGLKKVVFLSRAGVERKDDFLLKFNPFLKIGKWYEAEEEVKRTCAELGIDYAIVRTGALEGGPFYDSNREFASALEGSLYDVDTKAMELSVADILDGKTGRDLASQALIQALSREVPVFSVVGVKTGPLTCSVENHMNLPPAGPKKRKVYTPTPQEWDAAFAQA